MPQKILRFFDRESKRVTEAAFILAGSGILADLLSLFRDRLLAARFGASRELDLYYAAFRVPDFIYTFSLFLAASTALLPILVEKFSEDETNAKVFFRDIFSLFGITALALVALAYFLMPAVSPYVAPGFLPEEGARMILLSRILLFSPLLLGLSSLVSSVVQSFRRFYVYALSPLLYNLGIIFGILFWEPVFGLHGIVWGVVLGAALHLWVQLPTVFSLGFTLWPRFPKISREVISSLKLSLPRTLGLSLNQLVLTVITALGSTLGAGAVAVFNFAQNLQSVPLSVIGLSYAVGVFPTLSISFVRNRRNEFFFHFFEGADLAVYFGGGRFFLDGYAPRRGRAPAALALHLGAGAGDALGARFLRRRAYFSAGGNKFNLVGRHDCRSFRGSWLVSKLSGIPFMVFGRFESSRFFRRRRFGFAFGRLAREPDKCFSFADLFQENFREF